MARKKQVYKIFDVLAEKECKIVGKTVLPDGSIEFEFSGGFEIIMPKGTTDKKAIKQAKKNY